MKRLLFAFLFCAPAAFGQGIRFTPPPVTTTAVVNGTTVTVPVAASTIAFCNAPANATPCTNKATTYSDSTLATPCGATVQVVLDGTSSCVGAPDSLGNWGVWASPGQYTYTITSSAGASFGPYFVTLSPPQIATLTIKKGSGAGNYTSTSLTPVAVDGANLSYTVTIPTGWKLGIEAAGSITSATAVAIVSVVLYDGGCGAGAPLQQTQITPSGATNLTPWALADIVTGNGASHTINLCYFTANAADAVTMINSTVSFSPHIKFELVPSN